MSKPEDIPQDVFDAAWKLQGDTNYDVVAFNGGTTAEILQACEDDAVAIARAIMAATLAEREACAQVADEEAARRFSNSQAAMGGSWDFGPPENAADNQAHKAITAQSIAAAIRKRGDVNTARNLKLEG